MPTIEPLSAIEGVLVATPDLHRDDRGLMVETYRHAWIPGSRPPVQANRADRSAGCVVGLHYHLRQADYWYVVAGRARIVLHDLRLGSPTDGATAVLDLGAAPGPDGPHDHRGLYLPAGVAHGFASLTDVTLTYLVDAAYDGTDELGVAWDDPEVSAAWGISDPVLSERDRTNPRRAAIAHHLRPRHDAPRPS